jgi:hypothetical protein
MTTATRAWIATRKGLFRIDRTSGGWRIGPVSFLGEPVSMVLADPRDGTLYAALNLGHFGVKLHRSADQGASWEEVGVPVYPPQPEDRKDEAAWKLQQIWSLAAGGADQPGLLWAGTLPGGLFVSRDRGASWQLVESLWNLPSRKEWFGGGYDVPGIHSILVDPRDARTVTIAISCGGVWTTRDAGASWTVTAKGMRATFMPPERQEDPNIQDPHCVVRCRVQPDVLWCQHHNGIWRSTDGARQWVEIEHAAVSNFGFAVAVDPNDGDTAWFAPAIADQQRVPKGAALVVTRTRDGGRTFDECREGLPQSQCYELAYRHGLDVSPDGRSLALGTTTGGLWISDDQGNRWQTISSSLPPIHAVRFSA